MLHKAQRLFLKSLSTRISPLAYLTVYVSWVIGFFFSFLDFLPDVQHTLLHEYGILGSPRLWGIILLISSSIMLVGFKTLNRGLCKFGAMGNFIMWTFAAILYVSHSFWYAFISFALFHMVCQGYMYLTSALDSIWDRRVT